VIPAARAPARPIGRRLESYEGARLPRGDACEAALSLRSSRASEPQSRVVSPATNVPPAVVGPLDLSTSVNMDLIWPTHANAVPVRDGRRTP